MKKFDLRKWRKARGLSQSSFAELAKNNRDRVSRAETGKSPAALEYYHLFCMIYEIEKEPK